jgi:hypothetical protein
LGLRVLYRSHADADTHADTDADTNPDAYSDSNAAAI